MKTSDYIALAALTISIISLFITYFRGKTIFGFKWNETIDLCPKGWVHFTTGDKAKEGYLASFNVSNYSDKALGYCKINAHAITEKGESKLEIMNITGIRMGNPEFKQIEVRRSINLSDKEMLLKIPTSLVAGTFQEHSFTHIDLYAYEIPKHTMEIRFEIELLVPSLLDTLHFGNRPSELKGTNLSKTYQLPEDVYGLRNMLQLAANDSSDQGNNSNN